MIYQTEMTKEILQRIEETSRVKWNTGQLPTWYWDSKEAQYLKISYDPWESIYSKVKKMSLFHSEWCKDHEMCTADEFVDHCKRMLPLVEASEGEEG